MPFGANGASKVDQFVTPELARRLLRLGHRTHSIVEAPEHPLEPADISGDQWWPERIIKVTRWPSGDVGVTVVDRKTRKARTVAAKRQSGELSEDDSQRATRRARRRIWRGCQELEANCILTIAKPDRRDGAPGGSRVAAPPAASPPHPEAQALWSIVRPFLDEMGALDGESAQP